MSHTFTKRFDMEQYISKRALEINKLDQRALYKEISQDMLAGIYHELIQSLDVMEQKIQDDFKTSKHPIPIEIGLIHKDAFDATDKGLYPMFQEDTLKKELDTEKLIDSMSNGEAYYLYDVFLKLDYPSLLQYTDETQIFTGTMKAQNKVFHATFEMKRNEKYRKKIEELYHIFRCNKKQWMTVCSAYLNKFFGIYLKSVDGIIEGRVQEIEIDFRNLSTVVFPDIIPLWNIETYHSKTQTYPVEVDEINYEHRIFDCDVDEHSEYFISNHEVNIMYSYLNKGDLYIICDQPKPTDWQLLKVVMQSNKNINNLFEPILTNSQNVTLIQDIICFYGNKIRNKAEISRIIQSLGFCNMLKYLDLEILDQSQDIQATYDMNHFMEVDFPPKATKKILKLKFEAINESNYLNYDILSYIVTKIADIYSEFYCIGVLKRNCL